MCFPLVGGPVNDCKVDVAAKTTTENEIHKEKREVPVTLQNASDAGMDSTRDLAKTTR